MYTETFSERLAYARKQTLLTQKEVAEQLKISQSAITHYETGKREPDLETLAQMTVLYETTTDWLLGLAKPTKNITNVYESKITKELEREAKKQAKRNVKIKNINANAEKSVNFF